jgi:hypothetical protein
MVRSAVATRGLSSPYAMSSTPTAITLRIPAKNVIIDFMVGPSVPTQSTKRSANEKPTISFENERYFAGGDLEGGQPAVIESRPL